MIAPREPGGLRLLTLQEAAEALGYTVKGLRKIVDRSRAKFVGARTCGPTIKFFQAGKGSPIKFRPEWIEEFIVSHTTDPSTGTIVPPATRAARRRLAAPTSGLDAQFFTV